MSKSLDLPVALLLAIALCYWTTRTPDPAPESADPAAFSALRALKDVRVIGRAPHPVGSAANAQVRDYLLGRMTALGLSPRVQQGASFEVHGSHASGAAVENLIGVLKGRDASAPALALMAHYDSVPGSPGAADDAAGVATALEILRAIASRGTPERDIALILTDGEEAGLLGARAFFDEDGLATRIGYVINLETRGGGGRTAMFETAAMNGGDIDLFRRSAAMPDGNSLTVFVYQRLPNDTDFTVARQHGKVGLNYAFIGSQFDYHSPSSTPEQLDAGALQHMGTEVLPTVAALASGPLPARAPDVVYGDLFGWFVIRYSTAIGGLLLLALGAFAVVAVRGSWRELGKPAAVDLLRGVGGSGYLLALGGAALEFGRRLTGVGNGWIPYRALLARFPLFETMMALAGLGALLATLGFARRGHSRVLAAGLVAALGGGAYLLGSGDPLGLVFGGTGLVFALLSFPRAARPAELRIGLFLVPLAVSCALQVFAPTVSFIVTWPLIPAALAMGLLRSVRGHAPLRRLVVIVLAAVTMAWLGGLFHAVVQGIDLPLLALLPVWLAAPVTLSLLADAVPSRRASVIPAGAILVAALFLALWLRFTDPWSPRYPAPAEPVYVVDPQAQKAWHASLVPPDPWMRQFLAASGAPPTTLSLPLARTPVAAAAAPFVSVEGAHAQLTALADGRLSLTVDPPPGAARVVVSLRSSARIDAVTIDGRSTRYLERDGTPAELTIDPQHGGGVMWEGPSRLTMSFHASDPQSLKIQTAEIYERWMSPTPLPSLPASDEAWDMAGSTVVLGSVATGGD